MENENLDLLATIKKVAVPDAMYDNIMQRVQAKKMTMIPIYKFVVVASLLLGLICTEFYIVQKSQKTIAESNKISNILPVNDNSLYHE
jgi:hypothetical protein